MRCGNLAAPGLAACVENLKCCHNESLLLFVLVLGIIPDMLKKDKSKVKQNWFVRNLKDLLWAAVIAIIIRSLFMEPFHIPSGSMVPELLVGDYLFVTKWDYGYSRHSFPLSFPPFSGRILERAPQRGDIVVFKNPEDNSTDYIKRVMALPGETVQMKKGRLYINGQLIERKMLGLYQDVSSGRPATLVLYEETLPEGKKHQILELNDSQPLDDTGLITVPEGTFFAMGDNRDNSKDSRALSVGVVPFENLVGKARFIFYSNNGYSPFLFFWNWDKSIRWKRLFKGLTL